MIEKYILEATVFTAVGVIILIALVVWILRKLEAAKGQNDQEHYGIVQFLKTISGRVQWLMSTEIAERLQAEKQKAKGESNDH